MNNPFHFYQLMIFVFSTLISVISFGLEKRLEHETRFLTNLKLVEPNSAECKLYDNSTDKLVVKTDPNCVKLSYEIKVDNQFIPPTEYLVLHGSLVSEVGASLLKTNEVYKQMETYFLADNQELQVFNFYMPIKNKVSLSNGGIIPFKLKINPTSNSMRVALPELKPRDNPPGPPLPFTVISFKTNEEGNCSFKNLKQSNCIIKITDLTIEKGVHLFIPQ